MLEYLFIATSGQTAFTGTDANGNTLSYTATNLIVILNGVVLEPTVDYTATDGLTITLSSAAAVNDELHIVAFKSFTTADMVSATNGGTFGNSVTVNGTLTATSLVGDGSGLTNVTGGTAGIDDQASSTAVTIDTNGNLLVGSTGHFNYSASTTEITVGTAAAGSSAGGAVTFVSNNGATTLGYAGFQESEAAIGTMGARALKLTTDNIARMTIDASGRVTMPYQPYFYAYGAGGGVGQYYSNRNIGDSVIDNRGNHYSTASYANKFTAPVAGVYYFGGGALKYGTNTVSLQLRVNGNAKNSDYAEGTSGSQVCTVTMVIYLNANDYVQLFAQSGNWYDNGPSTSIYNWFTGCLIG